MGKRIWLAAESCWKCDACKVQAMLLYFFCGFRRQARCAMTLCQWNFLSYGLMVGVFLHYLCAKILSGFFWSSDLATLLASSPKTLRMRYCAITVSSELFLHLDFLDCTPEISRNKPTRLNNWIPQLYSVLYSGKVNRKMYRKLYCVQNESQQVINK